MATDELIALLWLCFYELVADGEIRFDAWGEGE